MDAPNREPVVILFVAAFAAFVIRRWWRSRRAAASVLRTADRSVPDLVELLVVLVRSGLTPTLAIRELHRWCPDPLRPGVERTIARLDAGERFGEALGSLTETHGVAIEPLVALLVQADRYGDPLEPILDRLATDARDDRRRASELRARRLPVQLSVPLVCCTLPAFVVLTIVPMLFGTFSSFAELSP